MLLENIVSWKLNIIINYFLVMKKNYNYNIYQNNYYIFERIINNLSEEQKKKMGFTNFFLYLEEIEIAELIYNLLVYYEDHTKKLISSSCLDHSKFEKFFQRLNEIKAAMDITYNVSQKCVNINSVTSFFLNTYFKKNKKIDFRKRVLKTCIKKRKIIFNQDFKTLNKDIQKRYNKIKKKIEKEELITSDDVKKLYKKIPLSDDTALEDMNNFVKYTHDVSLFSTGSGRGHMKILKYISNHL